MPLISVVIPTFNRASLLRETVESVLSQTFSDWEALIVDDRSTDSTRDAILRLCERDPRIRGLENRRTKGLSGARNSGIDAATGQWIAFLDDDDIWLPEKLQRQVDAIREQTQAVCVYTEFFHLVDGVRREAAPRPESHSGPEWALDMLLEWCVLPSSSMVKAELARSIWFREDVSDCEDVLFFIPMRRWGPFVRVPEALTGYRQSSQQITNQPGHGLRAVEFRFRWLMEHKSEYRADQVEHALAVLASRLPGAHERARWMRDFGTMRRCRQLWTEMRPGMPSPEPFRSWLPPKWGYTVKDFIDRRLRTGRNWLGRRDAR